MCFTTCNPLAPACSGDWGCYPLDERPVCLPDASEGMGGLGAPCGQPNECALGHACAPPSEVPDCLDDQGCCTPLCDLGDPMPPCGPGQQCVPFYDPRPAPPGLESLGACRLP